MVEALDVQGVWRVWLDSARLSTGTSGLEVSASFHEAGRLLELVALGRLGEPARTSLWQAVT